MTVCSLHVDLKKDSRVYQGPLSLITACLLMCSSLQAEEIDLSGFDVLDNEPSIKPNADPFVLNDVEELY